MVWLRYLASISLAQELGLHPVKVNAVIIRGLNDHEIEALAGFAHERSLSLRFIEFMPLDSARAWLKELVVPGRELLARLQTRFDLRPVPSDNPPQPPNAGPSRMGAASSASLRRSASHSVATAIASG
jgi:cyclic pyranopterin phosphate synthase